MITVICGTNRKNSYTRIISEQVLVRLKEKGVAAQLLDVSDLPVDFHVSNEVYGAEHTEYQSLLDQHISSADKFLFIAPEYNGSYPGIIKAFIDSFLPVRIRGKKAALLGVSSGRAGNLRGLEHLTGVLNYLNVLVVPFKLAISNCQAIVDFESRKITDPKTEEMIDQLLTQLATL